MQLRVAGTGDTGRLTSGLLIDYAYLPGTLMHAELSTLL